jgi:hypothetical protein
VVTALVGDMQSRNLARNQNLRLGGVGTRLQALGTQQSQNQNLDLVPITGRSSTQSYTTSTWSRAIHNRLRRL